MNIAFVLSYLSDRFGGPVTVVKSLGPKLTREEHRVSYWAPAETHERSELASLDGVHLYDLNWPRRWHRSHGLARALAEAIPSIDLLHINGLWLHPTYAAARIAHAGEVPFILCPAGTLEPWALRNRKLKWLKKAMYLKLVARSMIQRAACLHACSVKEADSFRQAGYRGPVTVIPNGVEIDDLSTVDRDGANEYWPDLKDRPVVLFMSRLSEEKGLDILIPLWAQLAKSPSHRDAVLVIAGPDDRGYAKTVEAMIDAHAAQTCICRTGMVQGQKKRALLRRADLFVLPSYSENFGIVVAEALACGTPVVTTTGTPWRQLEEVGAGRWVEPEPSELTHAISDVLNMSPARREAMGRRGRALVEQNYTWDAVVRKFETLCRCVLNGHSIPLHPKPMEANLA